jgi:osmoprotectant transport system permease protein
MNEHQQTLWEFMHQQADKLGMQTLQHIGLTFISLFIAVLIGLPLGIYITRKKQFSGFVWVLQAFCKLSPALPYWVL